MAPCHQNRYIYRSLIYGDLKLSSIRGQLFILYTKDAILEDFHNFIDYIDVAVHVSQALTKIYHSNMTKCTTDCSLIHLFDPRNISRITVLSLEGLLPDFRTRSIGLSFPAEMSFTPTPLSSSSFMHSKVSYTLKRKESSRTTLRSVLSLTVSYCLGLLTMNEGANSRRVSQCLRMPRNFCGFNQFKKMHDNVLINVKARVKRRLFVKDLGSIKSKCRLSYPSSLGQSESARRTSS